MRFFSLLPALAGLAAALPSIELSSRAHNGSVVIHPGPVADMIVSAETTLNGTHKGPAVVVPPGDVHSDQIPLPLSFVNNFGSNINAYLVGNCPNRAVCFIRGDGSIVYPSSGGSGAPVQVPSAKVRISVAAGQTFRLNLPVPINSARIYFAAGDLYFGMVATPNGDGLVQPAPNNPSDPSAGINWGFVELNVDPSGTIYANVSYVDFVGLALGMQLQDNNGPTQTTRGLKAGSVQGVCSDLRSQQSKDGWPWGNACMTTSNGQVIRVLAPYNYGSAFQNYWTNYVNSVYSKYQSTTLQMNTACHSNGNTITCANDEIAYGKPSASDIWGCNGGPFANTGSNTHKANLAILCAAFHRATLLQSGGQKQPGLPSSSYYTTEPSNHYSKSVHAHELDGRGYAFPYDDVNPGNENASGTVSSANPKSLLVWIGGN